MDLAYVDYSRKPPETPRFTHEQLNALRKRYAGVKYRHKRKGFNADELLSFERYVDILMSNCSYCGAEPACELTCDDGTILHVSSIDRIDSTRGYDSSNVCPACVCCNMAKGRMSISEFLAHIKRIYDTQHLESSRVIM